MTRINGRSWMMAAAGALVLGMGMRAGTSTASARVEAPPPAVVFDFEDGKAGQVFGPRVGGAGGPWFVPAAGWKAELVDDSPAEGKLALKLCKSGDAEAPFGNVMRHLDAKEYRGGRVKATAKMRIDDGGKGGQGQMWLRVDREGGGMGAFDNMGDRPVRSKTWTTATIEFEVDEDAAALNLGFMSVGGTASVFVDAVTLAFTPRTKPAAPKQAASAPKALSERGVENLAAAARLYSYVRFFHPSDQVEDVKAWDHFAVDVMEKTEGAKDAAELARRLGEVFAPIAPTVQLWAGSAEQAPALPTPPSEGTRLAQWKHFGAGSVASQKGNVYWSHVERRDRDAMEAPSAEVYAEYFVVKSLGGGVSARIPITMLADGKGTLPHGETPDALATLDGKMKLTALNRSTRLAGVAIGWGVFQHFYPYFDVVKTDWDAALPAALRKAAEDASELDYLYTLRELVAKLHDGHGGVYNSSIQAKSMLPLALAWAGKDLVVVGKHASASAEIKTGDVIVSIDGKTSEEVYREVTKRISAATEGWARAMALRSIVVNTSIANPAKVVIRRVDGTTHTLGLALVSEFVPDTGTPKRPKSGEELAEGIVYFDLCGTDTPALTSAMDALAKAKGIVFDVRGYPGQAAYELMQHLIDDYATSARWNVPIVRLPDREGWEWNTNGRWPLSPKEPRLKGKIAFLTDGRAISYAESIMGIVEHYKMGEIVGSTTAGTNGNVNPFVLPGGYNVTWTGMKVLKHDGSQHHGVGIVPTVAIEPTAKGIAEGKDEVLAKGVEVLRAQIGGATGNK